MTSRFDRTAADIASDIAAGMIPAPVYGDPEVFALERDRLFERSWVFVGHESEIPEPGDFVTRRVVDNSFIVTRGDDGNVRALFNMCLHRGMEVCRAEVGNTARFRCPYHSWAYANDGALVAIPFHDDAYGGEAGLARDDHRLLEPAQLAIRNGLIFICLDPTAPSLAEWLGDFAFYLDFYTRQSPAGIELRGPQRWRINANWKIGCENFVGDMYHTPFTHRSVVDIDLFREPTANKRKEGVLYFAGRGGGTTYKLPPGGVAERLAHVGYPPDMVERMLDTWSPEHLAMVGNASGFGDGFMVSAATVFPNLSLVHNWPKIRPGAPGHGAAHDRDTAGEEPVVPFISLRQWQPISATETEVLSWFAVDAAATDEFKRDSYKAYLMCFGSSGMFEQDDVENWVSITTAAQASMARRVRLNSRMGLGADGVQLAPPLDRFAGPGTARVGFGEFNQRAWLKLWADSLQAGRGADDEL